MRIVLLCLFAVLLSSGQILFKKAAIAAGEASLIGIFNVWTLFALVLYAAATVLWISILRTTPLSFAYPFAALGFIFVPIAARFIFGEEVGITYVLGTALILSGIILTSR